MFRHCGDMLNLMNTCIGIHFWIYILHMIISQPRKKKFQFFFWTLFSTFDLQNCIDLFIFLLKITAVFSKNDNMIFSKKLGLKNFMEVGSRLFQLKIITGFQFKFKKKLNKNVLWVNFILNIWKNINFVANNYEFELLVKVS